LRRGKQNIARHLLVMLRAKLFSSSCLNTHFLVLDQLSKIICMKFVQLRNSVFMGQVLSLLPEQRCQSTQ